MRSICSVSEIHLISSGVKNTSDDINGRKCATEDEEKLFLLISVGAKRVLTSWLLRNRRMDNVEETPVEQKHDRSRNEYKPSLGASSTLSFQWLSTDMPTKNSSAHGKSKDIQKMVGNAKNATNMNTDANTGSSFPEDGETESQTCLWDKYEDDWRYLAVTAFLVKCPGSR